MKKIVNINGMHCKHCAASVQEKLEDIEGVKSAKVDHAKNMAVISCGDEPDEKAIAAAVTEAGFEFVSIEEKKGLF